MDKKLYKKGLNFFDYMDTLSEHRAQFDYTYELLRIYPQDEQFFRELPVPVHVFCISQDWVVDCQQNVPVVARLVALSPVADMSILERDANPEVMEQFLTRGLKRVPVFAFYDSEFRELCRWTGRPKTAHALYNAGKDTMERNELLGRISEWYGLNKGKDLIRELRDLLEKAFKQLEKEAKERSRAG